MKGQVTFEFLMMAGVVLVMFILLMSFAYSQDRESVELRAAADGKKLLQDFAVKVNSVYMSGNNASRVHSLPATLAGGIDYTMSVYPRSVLLSYDSGQAHYQSARIMPERVNTTAIGDFSGRKFTIKNAGGAITFESM